MTPIFLIAPPRARASLLMRMLDASPHITMAGEADDFLSGLKKLHASRFDYQEKWAKETWPRHRLKGDDAAWNRACSAMLEGWISPPAGSTHCGVRLSFLGREGWESAVQWWSWLLELWPAAKLVFLTRDQGEIELSMMATPQLKWVPSYGKCGGCVGGRIKGFMESMGEFHALNPKRSVIIDSAELFDFQSLYQKLWNRRIPLQQQAWARELEIISGSMRELTPPPPAPAGTQEFDPFHPFVTAEEVDAHFAAAPPVALNPFAEGVTAEDLEMAFPHPAQKIMPAPEPPPDLPAGYKPRAPRKFKRLPPPKLKRAIVYPWLAKAAAWEELRYSIRSVEKFFEDKSCPIFILGDAPPKWLVPGGRVRWIEIRGYRKSAERGLFEARALGLQLANELLWMNDDFYFLRTTTWEEMRVALHCGNLASEAHKLIGQRRQFRQGKARAAFDLIAHGKSEVLNFAVHAPFLFERTKALEVLEKFNISHRGGLESIYHNWHGTPRRSSRGFVASALPNNLSNPRTLFHRHQGPGFETEWHLRKMFPDPSAVEDPFYPPAPLPGPPRKPAVTFGPGELEVFTLRHGNPDWLPTTAPTLDTWCSRHGYRLTVITDPNPALPCEKFATVAMIREFLRGTSAAMLFVDADIVADGDAPSFPVLPGFASFPEYFTRTLRKWGQWQPENGHDLPDWKYRNSGVWSCDREAAARFLEETETGPWELGYQEQHQFNVWWATAAAKGMQMTDLPAEWNRLSQQVVEPSWFYHLNGREKLSTLRRVIGLGLLPEDVIYQAPRSNRFLILTRHQTPATARLEKILSPLGRVEIVTDTPDQAVWIDDADAALFAGMTSATIAAPITAWSRAMAHVAATGREDEWVWFVEDDVAGTVGDFSALVYGTADVDLAALDVRSREDDPKWGWWRYKHAEWPMPWHSFNPLCRLSPRLLSAVIDFCRRHGSARFTEVMFASVAKTAGFEVMDFRADPVTRERIGEFHWRGAVSRIGGIAHPVKSDLAHARHCGTPF